MEDLVILNGRIVDGTGRPAFEGDIAVRDGILTQVGGVAGSAARAINAGGCIVTPGFVDIHTHYDGQVHWDPSLSCSSWNGVTSVVMGNCGMTFAPVRPSAREQLMRLMSSIEEISIESLRAGIDWQWETFPEFLDTLERRTFAVDVGVQIGHAAIRGYVMGERGLDNEPASCSELQAMAGVVFEAVRAGALGLTASRSESHRSPTGKAAPGYGLPAGEMMCLARAAADARPDAVIGMNMGLDIYEEFKWLRQIHRVSGLKVWFSLHQQHHAPAEFAALLEQVERSAREGEAIFGQYCGRSINFLMGLMGSRSPFRERPSFRALLDLPLAERVERLRDPAFRRRLFSENPEYLGSQQRQEYLRRQTLAFDRMFRLGEPPDYEPPPEQSIAAMADASGKDPEEIALDLMLERDGRGLILTPVTNYFSGDASAVWDMLHIPHTILGLGDAGAHVTRICDASIPTFMLTHWARDRNRGPKLSVEETVRKLTSDGATFYGLRDRGVLAVGKRADLNVIDFERLSLRSPEMLYDQPAGGARLVQRAEGYVATLVAGVSILENDRPTGEMPGRLIRAGG